MGLLSSLHCRLICNVVPNCPPMCNFWEYLSIAIHLRKTIILWLLFCGKLPKKVGHKLPRMGCLHAMKTSYTHSKEDWPKLKVHQRQEEDGSPWRFHFCFLGCGGGGGLVQSFPQPQLISLPPEQKKVVIGKPFKRIMNHHYQISSSLSFTREYYHPTERYFQKQIENKTTAKQPNQHIKMDNEENKRTKWFDLPTSDLALKTSSNCFRSSGGDSWSISAPSMAIGTLTPEIDSNNEC